MCCNQRGFAHYISTQLNRAGSLALQVSEQATREANLDLKAAKSEITPTLGPEIEFGGNSARTELGG